MSETKTLSWSFNILMILFLFYEEIIRNLFSSKGEFPPHLQEFLWQRFVDWPATRMGLLSFGGWLLCFLVGAILAQRFWNLFIADVFSFRIITYNEALAAILIVSIFPI